MYILKKIILPLILMALLFACQQPYNIDISNSKKILVVQGLITDQPGPYKISLTWASGFNTGNQADPISGAIVTISDEGGSTFYLTENESGNYYSDSVRFRAIKGRKYLLKIKLVDGDEYESTPTLMNNTPSDFNIFAKIGTNDEIGKDIYGNIVVTTRQGLYIESNIGFNAVTSCYVHFNAKVITQIMNSAKSAPGGPPPSPFYSWTLTSLEDIPDVAPTISDSAQQMVVNHQLGFLPYIVSLMDESSTMGPPQMFGWIVTTYLYSIPVEAYSYYQSIDNLLSSNNQIFDPVPSQIIGNIKCITDSTKTALGLFEVASVLTRHDFFMWASDSHYEHKILNSFTDTVRSGGPSSRPPFWIDLKK